MSIEDRFKQPVIAILVKRAANRCSNPDCGAITSGPTEDPNDAVNVGEAAHIYGANPGSARYEPSMTSTERSAITNAIWLCSNCHKLVDNDPYRYPAGLLFEWQRAHERRIAERVGKTGAEARQRYEQRHLEEFGRLSYLAERIILEKGESWEFRLTVEMLRYEMAPTFQRWSALQRGLYVKPVMRIDPSEFVPWLSDRMHEIMQIVAAFSTVASSEFARAWGDLGVAGSDTEIVTACRLFAEVCTSTLAWEEQVRFSRVDEPFTDVHRLLSGVASDLFEQARRIPEFIENVLKQNSKDETHDLQLVLSLPDGFEESILAAMERAIDAVRQRE